MDYLVGFNIITSILIRERREASQYQRDERCYSAGFEDGEGDKSQGLLVASRNWARQRGRFSSGPSRRNTALLTHVTLQTSTTKQ